ncbi:MAG: hypothetical protein U0637_07970 [Phycisphaerales bacterium]
MQHARAIILLAALLVSLSACASRPREVLVAPRTLTAPYDTTKGEVLWAVAPLRNESGASVVDENLLTDRVIGAIEEVQGVRCLPLSRTLAAMDALQMRSIRSPGDARALAGAMGAEAIVVGSVTAYDPYTPTLGLSLGLYPRSGAPGALSPLDPHSLSRSTTEGSITSTAYPLDRPVAVVSERWDAKNNQVLADVQAFSQGRMKQKSAMGWRRYLASMDLFSEFASYRAVDALLQQEWVRVARSQVPPDSRPKPPAGTQ